MSSSVGLVFYCCLYCSLLLRCYIRNSAFYPLNPQKISAFRLRILPVVTSAHHTPAHPHFTTGSLDHLDNSRSAPGGRQLVGQSAILTFDSACMHLPSLGGYMEGWVDLGTAVSGQPMRKTVYHSDFRKNTNVCPQRNSNLVLLVPQANVLPLDHCDLCHCNLQQTNT